MKILVTGTAGFIGFHVANRLIARGDEVMGLDGISKYYDVNLKYARLGEHGIQRSAVSYNSLVNSDLHKNYSFIQLELTDKENIVRLLKEEQFDVVVNLAAQAGVRYSITDPDVYVQSNIVGFVNVIEGCRYAGVKHLVYASSSSVYGLNEAIPFSTSSNVDHPISLYAASKKSNELTAHVYSHVFNLPTTGLRFFTAYGPWGRPDMALFLFTKSILEGKTIEVFNDGEMVRDFTYVDDIVEGVIRVIDNPPMGNPKWKATDPDASSSSAPYRIYNIGNNSPVKLLDFIEAIEAELGMKAIKKFLPLQPGEVPTTYADVSDLVAELGYQPNTPINAGVKNFIHWYKNYYKLS